VWEWNARLKQDSASLLRTAAGSRIISLPGSARGIRGYACALVIIDEAAWVDDATWHAARPLVAATGGRLIVQSTPGYAVGWFYDLVDDSPADWAMLRVTSEEAGTIDPGFLERERATMPPELFAMEYGAEFSAPAAAGTLLFDPTRVEALFVEAP
jgi:phage FluMu gp28-like protein